MSIIGICQIDLIENPSIGPYFASLRVRFAPLLVGAPSQHFEIRYANSQD